MEHSATPQFPPLERLIEDIVERKVSAMLTDRYMSLKEVAAEFGASRTWIYRQHALGHLKIYKLGGKTRVKRSELEKLAIAL